jgi:membrane protein DedA with SNARE-associated domain
MTRLKTELDRAPIWLYAPLVLIWATLTMMVGYAAANVMDGDSAFSGLATFAWIGFGLAAVVAAFITWWRYTHR